MLRQSSNGRTLRRLLGSGIDAPKYLELNSRGIHPFRLRKMDVRGPSLLRRKRMRSCDSFKQRIERAVACTRPISPRHKSKESSEELAATNFARADPARNIMRLSWRREGSVVNGHAQAMQCSMGAPPCVNPLYRSECAGTSGCIVVASQTKTRLLFVRGFAFMSLSWPGFVPAILRLARLSVRRGWPAQARP